jgi:hypothetical protein
MAKEFIADNGDTITEQEAKAIRALQLLARRWPRSLTIASMGGSLVVFHTGDERWGGMRAERAEAVLAEDFGGIPSDGGDW